MLQRYLFSKFLVNHLTAVPSFILSIRLFRRWSPASGDVSRGVGWGFFPLIGGGVQIGCSEGISAMLIFFSRAFHRSDEVSHFHSLYPQEAPYSYSGLI